MSCGRCELEAKYHGRDGTCPVDMDEPKCGIHGVLFMFDAEDHEGKSCVRCVACLILQNRDLQEQLDQLGKIHEDECRAQKRILIQRDETERQLNESKRLNDEYKKAMESVVRVLGPKPPDCGCDGCFEEMSQALKFVQDALADKRNHEHAWEETVGVTFCGSCNAVKRYCRAPLPFAQSGSPDFCGNPMPCEDHKT